MYNCLAISRVNILATKIVPDISSLTTYYKSDLGSKITRNITMPMPMPKQCEDLLSDTIPRGWDPL